MNTAPQFLDEETNPEARAPLHPAVVEWVERFLGRAHINYRMHGERIRSEVTS